MIPKNNKLDFIDYFSMIMLLLMFICPAYMQYQQNKPHYSEEQLKLLSLMDKDISEYKVKCFKDMTKFVYYRIVDGNTNIDIENCSRYVDLTLIRQHDCFKQYKDYYLIWI